MNIEKIESIIKKDGIVFLAYGGFLTQALISGMTEALEKEVEKNDVKMGISSNIFTIFIELSQNMMNYSLSSSDEKISSEGLIIVGKEDDQSFFIHSQNLILNSDMEKLKPKLENLIKLNKDEIKQMYREKRRETRNSESKGAGIGFYEIAKRCDKVSFEFSKQDNEKSYFHFRADVNLKK